MFRAFLIVLGFCFLGTICVFVAVHLNLHPLPQNAVADRVLVEKAVRRLTLFHENKRLKTYRVALGGSPVGPKEQEGDQRTPEGNYRIDFHKEDSDFHRALHISYPTQREIDRAAARGVSPGGDI